MDVFDLPIYREYFETFLKIFKELEDLKQSNSSHKKLVDNAYHHAIVIFPNLNAGYNYWSMKGKLDICTTIKDFFPCKDRKSNFNLISLYKYIVKIRF
jgi:hypothetical protein